MTHYDARLTPTLTLAISGDLAVIAYDGDLTAAARLSIVDVPALRRALDNWEDTQLVEAASQGDGWRDQ